MFGRWRRLASRPDFRRRPIAALWKRFHWRLRWSIRSEPWSLSLPEGLRIDVLRSGAGALIYYQGVSEPAVAEFVLRFLRPGMTFVDIGALFGEYTLLAARRVGPSGRVHSFEPAPASFDLLVRNVNCNQLRNVDLHRSAVADRDCPVEFELNREPSLNRMRALVSRPRPVGDGMVVCPCTSLDTWSMATEGRVDLIKVDVEGAEPQVLKGSRRLLELPAELAPIWIVESHPHAWSAFGFTVQGVRDFLARFGYRLYTYCRGRGVRAVQLDTFDSDARAFDGNLLASKRNLPWS